MFPHWFFFFFEVTDHSRNSDAIDGYMRNVHPLFKKSKTEALFGAIQADTSFYEYNEIKKTNKSIPNQPQLSLENKQKQQALPAPLPMNINVNIPSCNQENSNPMVMQLLKMQQQQIKFMQFMLVSQNNQHQTQEFKTITQVVTNFPPPPVNLKKNLSRMFLFFLNRFFRIQKTSIFLLRFFKHFCQTLLRFFKHFLLQISFSF